MTAVAVQAVLPQPVAVEPVATNDLAPPPTMSKVTVVCEETHAPGVLLVATPAVQEELDVILPLVKSPEAENDTVSPGANPNAAMQTFVTQFWSGKPDVSFGLVIPGLVLLTEQPVALYAEVNVTYL